MKKSYSSNYLKIYFWQALAISLNFLSLFVVTPLLTSMPVVFGIYSICVSLTIFLSYSDLGFIPAAYKYCSECFARGDHDEETALIGFVSFILLFLLIPFILMVLLLSLNPAWLIKNISDLNQITIASRLLLILAVSSPIMVGKRIIQIIFGIRIEDYVYQRIGVLANLINIGSVLYFFGQAKYDIVGYYLFQQVVNLASLIVFIGIIRKKYDYDLIGLLKSVKFSVPIYNKIKGLAFTSLYGMISWVMYYELDAIAIARLLGAEKVAIYVIPMALFNFFRTIFGTVYTPFAARFNHFVGTNDLAGLRQFYFQVIVLTMPIVLFPIISIEVLMKPFIYSWVGSYYLDSIPIASILLLCYLFSYISYPANLLLVAQKKIKWINIISTFNFLVFWTGVIATLHYWGVASFAVFKFLTMLITGIFFLMISARFMGVSISEAIKKIYAPMLVPAIFLYGSLLMIGSFFPLEKNKLLLVLAILSGGIGSFLAMIIYSFFSQDFRNYARGLWEKAFKYRTIPLVPLIPDNEEA